MLRMSARILATGAVLGVLQTTASSVVADDKTPPARESTEEKASESTKPASPLANLLNSLFGGSESQADEAVQADDEVLEIESDFVYDAEAEKKKNAELRAQINAEGTHEQTKVITVAAGSAQHTFRLNAFSLAKNGNILAGVGTEKGEIRVLDPDGKPLDRWSLPVVPEAIHTTPKGEILVAGDGRLLRLDANGKVLVNRQAPHAKSSNVDKKALRAQVEAQLKQNAEVFESQIEAYGKMIAAQEESVKKLTDKGVDSLSFAEKRRLTSSKRAIANLKTSREAMKKYVERNAGKEPTDEEIDRQVATMARSKTQTSSISVQDKSVFVACRATVGYGFDVWRMDAQFENAKKIVTGLRGCCGQMDVQCGKDGLFVAENARHRVSRYDVDGKLLNSWGKRAREGLTGFGSCCNPMNVAFGPGGEVYTSESYTGRIKRFDADGKLLGVVGAGEIGSGCVNVTIRVSRDGSRVYLMNITESKIVLLSQKPAKTASGKDTPKTGSAATIRK